MSKYVCHSDWSPTFLSEEIEESCNIFEQKSKDTSVTLGMTHLCKFK